MSGVFVEHVCSEAAYAGRVACDDNAQVVLGDDFDGEVMVEDVYVRMALDGSDEAGLYFRSRVVLVVQYAEFRVSAFAVQVKFARFVFVEFHSPADELLDLRGRAAHDHLHGRTVVDPVACHHRVVDMFLEIVHLEVGHRGDASLRKVSVGFFQLRLADDGDGLAFFGHFQGKAHACDARADNQIIVFVNHGCLLYLQAAKLLKSAFP